jgi:metal-responsive CopG/Arc/MetJ family transcriptional regulator
MSATVKTAISIDKSLFEQAEAVAQELEISRSHLFSLALEQYLRRRQGRQMLEQINAAYSDDPDPEEQLLLEKMRKSVRKQLEGTW